MYSPRCRDSEFATSKSKAKLQLWKNIIFVEFEQCLPGVYLEAVEVAGIVAVVVVVAVVIEPMWNETKSKVCEPI